MRLPEQSLAPTLLAGSTYELNQLETFLAAVLVGAVLGGLWEVLSLYRRSTSPAD
jgi:hypothetical protein